MSDTFLSYIPHGIDSKTFFPIDEQNPGSMRKTDEVGVLKNDYELMQKFKRDLFKEKEFDFIILYNNRNIRRKMVGDVVLAFKEFCDSLDKKYSNKCALVLHTTPVDQNGTDLPELVRALCPTNNIIFSTAKLTVQYLNYLYNLADVTINISSAEGFGLCVAESIMSGTPVIVNTHGGLQDQAGFRNNEGRLLTVDDFSYDWGTNSDGRYTEHGEWAKVVFPKTISLVGSPPTPYIFDSRCSREDVVDKMQEWYNTTKEERKEAALKGREFLLKREIGMSKEHMCDRFMSDMDYMFENWKPIDNFKLIKAT